MLRKGVCGPKQFVWKPPMWTQLSQESRVTDLLCNVCFRRRHPLKKCQHPGAEELLRERSARTKGNRGYLLYWVSEMESKCIALTQL